MFITLEGIEGVGKSTQLPFIASELERLGIQVTTTREPGGTAMGEEIRDILLAHRHERVAPMAELLLMFAARAQHIETVIQPALDKGHWVLCDRFSDATYAYQGGGRGVPLSEIQSLETLVLRDFKPHVTLLFDAPAAVALQRIQGGGRHPDRFESEAIDFFERARAVYHKRAAEEPHRFKMIDATQSLSEVRTAVSNGLRGLVEQIKG